MSRTFTSLAVGFALTTLSPLTALAALGGSAVVTNTAFNGSVYSYTISVNNTGTTPIGTLWFAWIPGQNYLTSTPIAITSPAGWTSSVIGSGANQSIRWTTSSLTQDIDAGGSLAGFSFTSAMSPTQLAGNSPSFPGTPVTTSFFYSGGAFSDAGFRFVASVIPAPGSAAALAGAIILASRRRR